MKKSLALLLILLPLFAYADSPYRLIAILENERKLETEPDVNLLPSSNQKMQHQGLRRTCCRSNWKSGNSVSPAAVAERFKHRVRAEVAFALGQIRSRKGLQQRSPYSKIPMKTWQRLAIDSIGKIGALEICF